MDTEILTQPSSMLNEYVTERIVTASPIPEESVWSDDGDVWEAKTSIDPWPAHWPMPVAGLEQPLPWMRTSLQLEKFVRAVMTLVDLGWSLSEAFDDVEDSARELHDWSDQ